MTQTWKTTPGLEKLGLRMCLMHGKLFSAKEGAQCKKCALSVPQKLCKRGHPRSVDAKRCAQCDKEQRLTKKAEATETVRAENKAAAEQRAARRAGLGEGIHI
jgi:hypothetical protein